MQLQRLQQAADRLCGEQVGFLWPGDDDCGWTEDALSKLREAAEAPIDGIDESAKACNDANGRGIEIPTGSVNQEQHQVVKANNSNIGSGQIAEHEQKDSRTGACREATKVNKEPDRTFPDVDSKEHPSTEPNKQANRQIDRQKANELASGIAGLRVDSPVQIRNTMMHKQTILAPDVVDASPSAAEHAAIIPGHERVLGNEEIVNQDGSQPTSTAERLLPCLTCFNIIFNSNIKREQRKPSLKCRQTEADGPCEACRANQATCIVVSLNSLQVLSL